jgi:Tat protein translocase TatB subunit
MFGLSLSEIFVIGLVALIVIGPERLPKTARALGLLIGRAQRYVNDIKSDIEREMHVDDIKKFKDEVASNVTDVKSSVEDGVTSITKPLKNISNPLDTVKSEVQDLEKQLKGNLNPLPDLNELKLDEAVKKTASEPLKAAAKAVASEPKAKTMAAAAGVAPTVNAPTPELSQTQLGEQGQSIVKTHASEVSVEPSASFRPAKVVEPATTKKLPESTVAEALIYPTEEDASLASGVDVVKQRWSPFESQEVISDGVEVNESTEQVAGIYDGPTFEPLEAPPPLSSEEQELHDQAWGTFVESQESPIDADKSLEGVALWEQMPEVQPVQDVEEPALASAKSQNKNNLNSDNGGSNV